jgi:hypothetical protein
MQLYAGLLRDDLAGDVEKVSHVKKIEREIDRLTSIVSDFLEFAGRPKLDLRKYDLADLLATVKSLQDDKLGRAGGRVSGALHIDKDLMVDGTVAVGQRLIARGGAGGAGLAKDPDSGLHYGGQLAIKGNAAQLDFISTEYDDWAICVDNNKMRFVRQPWSDELVLDGAGRVGIGTEAPRAKLEVIGDLNVTDCFIRKIRMATGLGPTDLTDNGQIVSRVLTFDKVFANTAIRIIWCDNLRVRGSECAARWEIRVDGNPPPGGRVHYDKYSRGEVGIDNDHDPTTVVGYAIGVPEGRHAIGVWVGPIGKYSCDACTGWDNSLWTLEAQEVWI